MSRIVGGSHLYVAGVGESTEAGGWSTPVHSWGKMESTDSGGLVTPAVDMV